MKKKKLTLILVPEAHEPVKRIHTSKRIARIVVLSICIAAALFAGWLAWVKRSYDGTVEMLATQITEQKRSHQSEVQTKEETIHQLQNEIITLTNHTNEVQEKLEQLQQLELEIRTIANVTLPDMENGEDSPVQAAGGALHLVGEEEMLRLADATELSLLELSDSLTLMSERLTALKQELEHLEAIARRTPSIWPAKGGSITSGFGYRIDPFTRRSAFHSGIDIDGRSGDDIYAAAEGIVKETGTRSDWGNYVIIEHSSSIQTLYAHLSRTSVEEGQFVDKGETIGYMGSTGRSTGTHLHYEVHEHGTPVNPTAYLP